MLTAIEDMKYFLHTAYRYSKEHVGSTIEVKFQGLCQGKGAAPASWAVISITIINAHKIKVHGGHFIFPISKRLLQLPEWEVTRRTPNNALLREAYPPTARPHWRPAEGDSEKIPTCWGYKRFQPSVPHHLITSVLHHLIGWFGRNRAFFHQTPT